MPSQEKNAEQILQMLEQGRNSERVKAINEAANNTDAELRGTLRDGLCRALEGAFKPELDEDFDFERSETRGWLLACLGRLLDQDPRAEAVLRKHLDPQTECKEWNRFWALEGMAAAMSLRQDKKPPSSLRPFAEMVRSQPNAHSPDTDMPLAWSLATVILEHLYRLGPQDVSQEDPARSQACLHDIYAGLKCPRPPGTQVSGEEGECHPSKRIEAMARALRVIVPTDERIIRRLSEIVSHDNPPEATYDAICVLGHVDPNGLAAKEVATTLQSAIERFGPYGKFDSSRRQAIQGLGTLKARRSVVTLLSELTDQNPSIAHEAALALKKILGLQYAVSRILGEMVEAKRRKADLEPLAEQYANALRVMVKGEKEDQLVQQLESAMATDMETQEVARMVLMELGGAVAFRTLRALVGAVKDYQEVLRRSEHSVRMQFEASLREARIGFATTLGMDVVVFILGIVLLAVTARQALMSDSASTTAEWVGIGVSGGLGVFGVIHGTLIAKPREMVEKSVDHMVRLKLVFFGFLNQLNQVIQLFTRNVLRDEPMTARELQRFADMVQQARLKAIQDIQEAQRPAQQSVLPGSPTETPSPATTWTGDGPARGRPDGERTPPPPH